MMTSPAPEWLGQNGEDRIIADLVSGVTKGRILDIGAHDGETFSNSRRLLEKGWGGVLVEPEPAAFLKLAELYADRQDVDLVNCAVGGEWSLATFWRADDLVSTTVRAHYDLWSQHRTFTGKWYVPVLPIRHLLRTFGAFDVISIDVEGVSASLFGPALEAGARVICVEHDGHAERLAGMAAMAGYEAVEQNLENLIVAKR